MFLSLTFAASHPFAIFISCSLFLILFHSLPLFHFLSSLDLPLSLSLPHLLSLFFYTLLPPSLTVPLPHFLTCLLFLFYSLSRFLFLLHVFLISLCFSFLTYLFSRSLAHYLSLSLQFSRFSILILIFISLSSSPSFIPCLSLIPFEAKHYSLNFTIKKGRNTLFNIYFVF